ncbi:CPBP family intramembrane glutamic endopeptidase [Methanothermococcus okinawensis]|uniref:Abortive infection protein n=1 Tax=Methanothermococcus okinawensis (strain DSM 14208 / JCM 11175 / IH1) TaxID=647113 RepID=F8AMX9_METOI|nr:CPBP family intramembrane glutamic endopeptidase [Methanothermococcus okinawensis]AEH06102.1 Abortive infection protein [Methanothermococcus okinawensis IH1]
MGCIIEIFNVSLLINIIFSFFAVMIYLTNLVEGLNSNKLKNIILNVVLLFDIIIAISSLYTNIDYIYKGIFLGISLLSMILLINKRLFDTCVKKLNMDMQWSKITHRIFFPLSLYVLLNPIGYTTSMGAHLMIFLNGFFQMINQLSFHILMFAYSFIGVGLGTRRGLKSCLNRLNIGIPNIKYIIAGFLAIFFFDYFVWNILPFIVKIISHILPNFDMYSKITVESSNVENTVQSIKNIAPSLMDTLILTTVVGISEELIFRGALQPRFGNIYTSLLFTVLHFQYFSVLALLEIYIISYLLGVIKEKTNTSTTAFIHIIYDFVSIWFQI